MEKLVSMKLDAEERKEMTEPALASSGPSYPWGLRLELNDDTLKKLGISALPKVGETKMLHAKVDVSAVSESETLEGHKSRSVSLQITHLGLESKADE